MKIALSGNTAWGSGGQGASLAHAAGALSDTGDLRVYCAEAEGCAPGLTLDAVGRSPWSRRLGYLPVVRRRNDWGVLLSDLHFDRQVSRRLRVQPCDLFIGVAAQCCLSFKAARAGGAGLCLYCLNSYLPFMRAQTMQELDALGDSTRVMHPGMIERFEQECSLADLILVNSRVARETFVQAGFPTERLAVLPPAVDTQRFRPGPISPDRFRVLYVGTVDPRKGVHYLLEAFGQAQIPEAELWLVGGPSTRTMKRILHAALDRDPNIRQFFADFGHQDPLPVFGRCSVLVLPSVEDGFGLVALEAMACGLPVIVTSHCGAADLIEEGVNGFVVPPRHPEIIARRLEWLAERPEVCSAMGRAARTTAEGYTQAAYTRTLRTVLAERRLAAIAAGAVEG